MEGQTGIQRLDSRLLIDLTKACLHHSRPQLLPLPFPQQKVSVSKSPGSGSRTTASRSGNFPGAPPMGAAVCTIGCCTDSKLQRHCPHPPEPTRRKNGFGARADFVDEEGARVGPRVRDGKPDTDWFHSFHPTRQSHRAEVESVRRWDLAPWSSKDL